MTRNSKYKSDYFLLSAVQALWHHCLVRLGLKRNEDHLNVIIECICHLNAVLRKTLYKWIEYNQEGNVY